MISKHNIFLFTLRICIILQSGSQLLRQTITVHKMPIMSFEQAAIPIRNFTKVWLARYMKKPATLGNQACHDSDTDLCYLRNVCVSLFKVSHVSMPGD